MWCELADLPKSKHALAIHCLIGRARVVPSELNVEDLKKNNSVDNSQDFIINIT